jgi:hypothetical protein
MEVVQSNKEAAKSTSVQIWNLYIYNGVKGHTSYKLLLFVEDHEDEMV